jgi:16S rRNA processing protein RimM
MAGPADSVSGVQRRIIVGKISGLYGVQGWVKVLSYTRPVENILSYTPWLLGRSGQWESREVIEGSTHGKGLIAKLDAVNDREVARSCIGKDIALYREQMPALPDGQYYWCDLVGMEVENRDGIRLGTVVEIRETGANDVLVVEGERRYLIPLIMDRYVLAVDVDSKHMTVDWEPEYS